jgi:hypothetical protein
MFAPPAQGQVYKCKVSTGKTLIQDHPCEGVGVKTEQVRSVRQITPEEYGAAQEVHQRNATQLGQIQREEARSQAEAKARWTADESRRQAEAQTRARRDEQCKSSLLKEKEMGESAYRSLMLACNSGAADPGKAAAEIEARKDAERTERSRLEAERAQAEADRARTEDLILPKGCTQSGNIVRCK